MKKRIGIFLIAMLITSTLLSVQKVNAANNNIEIDTFVKLLVNALELDVDKNANNPYLESALKNGILKDGDFKNYTDYITRTDVAVLANRADEYLHGNTVTGLLVKEVQNKRISDIKKIDKNKREAVAKIVAKGMIKGFSNRKYVQNREFRGNNLISTNGAKSIINLVLNQKGRAKISPDGQLIRTTNLPKNYKDYEYILECFPNSFYEHKFRYQRLVYSYEPKELIDYASPARMKDRKTNLDYDTYKYKWAEKIRLNLETRLNIDYRTVDEEWINTLRSTYYFYNYPTQDKEIINRISKYVNIIKKNKVIIKSQIVTVEPSTLYDSIGTYIRVYVKFKISANDMSNQDDLIYGDIIKLYGLSKDKWFEGTYDIELATVNGSSDGYDYAIFNDSLNDYYFKKK